MSLRLKNMLRISVTLGLMALVLSWVDPARLTEIATTANSRWIALSALFFLGIVLLEAIQFAAVARAFDTRIAFPSALQVALTGRFYALFTPAMIGSDIYRVVALRDSAAGLREALHITAVSRLISLAALVPVMLAGTPWLWHFSTPLQFAAYASIIGAATGFVAVIIIAPPDRLARIPYLGQTQVMQELVAAAQALQSVARKSRQSSQIWTSAIGQHLFRVLSLTTLGVAFGVNVGIEAVFAIAPVSLLIAMLPLSLGGWGLREISLVGGLSMAGASPDAVLLTSVGFGLIGTGFGLAGAVWGGLRPK